MPFNKISDLLRGGANKHGLKRQVQAAMILEFFTSVVEKMFDKESVVAMNPLHVKDFVLTVAVESPILAQELKLRERQIIGNINEKAGKDVIKSLRFLS